MKKFMIGILSATFIFGAGSYTFAQGNENGILSFEQMKPFMEKMHPNFSNNQLKSMYEACHGDGGMMENISPKDMMNNF